ncbi:hypothetical protein GCM10009872_45660 [Actinopolymorpha rutila]
MLALHNQSATVTDRHDGHSSAPLPDSAGAGTAPRNDAPTHRGTDVTTHRLTYRRIDASTYRRTDVLTHRTT